MSGAAHLDPRGGRCHCGYSTSDNVGDDMRWKALAVVGAALMLAGLAGCTDPVIMRDPKTGETADCGSRYGVGLYALTATERIESCVREYQRQGWLRTPR